MLVLSRQRDETIMIGDEVEITVVDIRGDKVRLGVTAPTRIAVHRKEVYEAIEAENRKASRLKGEEIVGFSEPPKAAKPGAGKNTSKFGGGLTGSGPSPSGRVEGKESRRSA